MLQSELATITPEPIMKDTTWSTVRVSPLVAVARGMLRLRIKTTPRSVFSSFAQFSQLAVSEIVKELLKSALVTKRYRHDSEVVILRNKLMFKRIHFTECTDSESASRQNSAVGSQLADTACFSQSTYSHTYRRRSSAVEYSRCLVKC